MQPLWYQVFGIYLLINVLHFLDIASHIVLAQCSMAASQSQTQRCPCAWGTPHRLRRHQPSARAVARGA
jgi:hypothetical protein